MHTCPNCGEIVMEGDPYCTECGATLSWSDDSGSYGSSGMSDPIYFQESSDDIWESERRHQELLKKISETYDVELADLDVKDNYTEYIFLRKRPYYTLRMVATDQYGATIGIMHDKTSVDFTSLLEDVRFRRLTEGMDYSLMAGLYRDEISLKTEDGLWLLDTDSMTLKEKEPQS